MNNKFLKVTTVLSSMVMFPGMLLADSYYNNPIGDGDGVAATENNNGVIGYQTRVESDGSSFNKNTAVYLPDGVSTGVDNPEPTDGEKYSGGKTGVRGGSVDVDVTVYNDKIVSDLTVTKPEGVSVIPGKRIRNRKK